MKRYLYGKRMFIADLLIVSLWALFAWHQIGTNLVMMSFVLMRIALCFELYRKSRWAFSGAILFALGYICCFFNLPDVEFVVEPISHLIYVMGCLLGYSEYMVDLYSPYSDETERLLIWILVGVITVWLAIVPIICSIRFKSVIPVYRHKRKIWWYVAAATIVVTFLFFVDCNYFTFLLSVLLSLTPIAYQVIYRKESVLKKLLSDRVFMLYLALLVAFFIPMLVGLFPIRGVRYIVATLVPVSVYVIILKLLNAKTIKTLPAVLLGIAGLLYVNVFMRIHEWVIILLSLGGILSVIASCLTYRQVKSLFASLSLLIASSIVFPMLILGYNPYASIMADNVRSIARNHSGLYKIIWNGKEGLRDRYGTVIPPENERISFLDNSENYVAVLESEKSYAPASYYVYCLPERRIVISSFMPITAIEKDTDIENEYNLIDENGRRFASFSLPVRYYGGFYKDIEFKAQFSEIRTPIEQYFDRINDGYVIDARGNRYWEYMKQSNPAAYDLLGKTLAMSGIECSPANDLTFAEAFAEVVRQDIYYKGDVKQALKELDEILDILGGGNQPDLNQCAEIGRLLESLKLSISYGNLISSGEIYYDEYVSWHNLIEAIISFYEYANYRHDWYSSKPMDMELEKAQWLKQRRELVEVENDVIGGTSRYVCPIDDAKTIDDAIKIADTFHCEYAPDYYHPMYHEIAPAFKSWLNARNNVMSILPESQASSYSEITKELESNYAELIENLDYMGLHPVLDWEGVYYKYHRSVPY